MTQAISLRQSPCGGVLLSVGGEPCLLRPSGALYLPQQQTLVASDLHLEKGSSFRRYGQLLPPFDSCATLDRLEAEILALLPERVVLLGDSFHDRGAVERLMAAEHARIAQLAQDRDWVWLEGNHDLQALAGALDRLPGRIVQSLMLGPLNLIHEPAPRSEPMPQQGEIAGHLHPAVRMSRYGRSVRSPCFITDGHRLLLPAFGAFTGGLDISDPAIADLFHAPPLIVARGRDRVYPLASTAIRRDKSSRDRPSRNRPRRRPDYDVLET